MVPAMPLALQQELKVRKIEFQNTWAEPIRSFNFWPVNGRTHPVAGSMVPVQVYFMVNLSIPNNKYLLCSWKIPKNLVDKSEHPLQSIIKSFLLHVRNNLVDFQLIKWKCYKVRSPYQTILLLSVTYLLEERVKGGALIGRKCREWLIVFQSWYWSYSSNNFEEEFYHYNLNNNLLIKKTLNYYKKSGWLDLKSRSDKWEQSGALDKKVTLFQEWITPAKINQLIKSKFSIYSIFTGLW